MLFNTVIATLVWICLIYILSAIIKKFIKKEKSIDKPSTQEESKEEVKEVEASEVIEDEKAENKTGGIIATVLIFLLMPFVLSGCSMIGGVEGLICSFLPESEHCFQGAAVDQGDADECAKVEQPAKFKSMGSNPPKDKCYLMIAQTTGDLEACKKIAGGLMSYTQEECILSASVENENPSGCQMLKGNDKAQCISKLAPKMTADKVLEIDSQIEIINDALKKGSDPDLEKQLKGLQTKRDDTLAVMTKENKAEYSKQSDPLNKEIIGDWAVGTIDSVTKNKMIDLNERLKAQGTGMTKEQYDAVRDYYKFVNDPTNDIDNMDDKALAKDRFGDKVKNVVDKLKFWKTNDTSQEKALDEQIRFYDRMALRQAGIDKGLSERETNLENTVDKIKEKALEKGADIAKDKAIEEIFGEVAGKTVGVTTKVLGEAIDEVQEEAKSAEFRGLVKAYNDGMAEEASKFGGDINKAHAEVVKKLMADPYSYASGDSFAKYGNLIENKDCDGSNPHCIRKDVFWKAMKKSYNYQHQQ